MGRMEGNFYRGLGLDDVLVACSCFRKSRLMLANNFLVGTRFNSSRFFFASIKLPRQFVRVFSNRSGYLSQFFRLPAKSLGFVDQSFELTDSFVHGRGLL